MLADHNATYASPYYDSDWDRAQNVDAQLVCQAATLLAHSMYTLAMAPGSEMVPLTADCALVAQLLECMISNASCELFRGPVLPPSARVGEYSHYVGVFQGVYGPLGVGTKAVYELLHNWTADAMPRSCGK